MAYLHNGNGKVSFSMKVKNKWAVDEVKIEIGELRLAELMEDSGPRRRLASHRKKMDPGEEQSVPLNRTRGYVTFLSHRPLFLKK